MKLILLIFGVFLFIHTTNAQWTVKHLNENSDNTGTLKFKNDSLGLFMGYNSMVLKTTNAGNSWDLIPLNVNIYVNEFQFIGDSMVFAVGSSKLIKSGDLGSSWDSLSNIAGKQLNSLWFFNEDSGFVAGYDGIYRTHDQGNSWDTVWSVTQFGYKYGEIRRLVFSSSEIGYAIGTGRNSHNNPLFDNFLLKSYDAGATWDTITTFYHSSLSSMFFINPDTGFIGTESEILYKTTDGGSNWIEIAITENGNAVNSIQFISESTGFAAGGIMVYLTAGSIGSGQQFFISKTIDGGETWTTYDTLGVMLNSIYFINDTTGFVSGYYELIMKSGGQIDKLPADYPWNLLKPMGINENKQSFSNIEIYPNPTTGMITIQSRNLYGKIKKISLTDSSVQIIKIQNSVSDQLHELDLSFLKSGIYFVKVESTDKTETLKVVKR